MKRKELLILMKEEREDSIEYLNVMCEALGSLIAKNASRRGYDITIERKEDFKKYCKKNFKKACILAKEFESQLGKATDEVIKLQEFNKLVVDKLDAKDFYYYLTNESKEFIAFLCKAYLDNVNVLLHISSEELLEEDAED